ncbi:MAG: hypothetical protein PHX08_20860 [Lachnospiraceae bacterium]|nr:hypothetical protein [Lachnospiraceae bacterium]
MFKLFLHNSLGLLLASFVTTGFSVMPLLLAWGNVLAPFLVFIVMKAFHCDFDLKHLKDIVIEVIILILAPIISGVWILGGFVLFGVMPASALLTSIFAWWLGGSLVNLIIAIPLMKFVFPLLKRFNLA